jgi:CheY-like chemotaxis protein
MALPPGTYIRIAFADQGCGISEGDLSRIFDPYFTNKKGGTGLGLASVHSIIARHGGHIGVSSVLGEGATFVIHLPSTGAPYREVPARPVVPPGVGVSGGALLVMDDEEMIRTLASAMLTHLGYRVATCEDGAQAVARYLAAQQAGVPFAAVLMDLTIPGGMGGREAAEHILALDPDACLIVSSGYSTDPVMADYRRYGFNGAVKKPYSMAELRDELSLVLGRKEQ